MYSLQRGSDASQSKFLPWIQALHPVVVVVFDDRCVVFYKHPFFKSQEMHTIFSLQTLFVASFYAMFVIDWNWFCLFAVKGRLAQTGRDCAAGKGKGAKDAFWGEILVKFMPNIPRMEMSCLPKNSVECNR